MSKVYFYTDVQSSVADEEDVIVSVKFPSAATTGFTDIKLPNGEHKGIKKDGQAMIGKATSLKNKQIIINARPFNYAEEVKEVKIKILINNEIIVTHENSKEIEPTPSIFIILTLK